MGFGISKRPRADRPGIGRPPSSFPFLRKGTSSQKNGQHFDPSRSSVGSVKIQGAARDLAWIKSFGRAPSNFERSSVLPFSKISSPIRLNDVGGRNRVIPQKEEVSRLLPGPLFPETRWRLFDTDRPFPIQECSPGTGPAGIPGTIGENGMTSLSPVHSFPGQKDSGGPNL